MLTAVGQRELTSRRTEETPTIRSPSGTPTRKVTIKKKFKNHAQKRCNKCTRSCARVCVCARLFSVQFYEGLGHRRSRPRRRSWQKTRPPPPPPTAHAFHNQTACNRIRPRGGYSDVSSMRVDGYFSKRPWSLLFGSGLIFLLKIAPVRIICIFRYAYIFIYRTYTVI